MPKYELPGDDFPHSDDLIRDLGWDHPYGEGSPPGVWPEMLIRSIYDILESEIRVGRGNRGNPMRAYRKAFNATVMTMARKTHPRRAVVSNGTLTLTPLGEKLNAMYAGKKKIDGKPGSYIMRRYGKKKPAEMKLEFIKKLRKFRIIMEVLKEELADGMPNQSPVKIP